MNAVAAAQPDIYGKTYWCRFQACPMFTGEHADLFLGSVIMSAFYNGI